MLTYVTKRDKRRRNFNPKHIYDAITAAFKDSKEKYTEDELDTLVSTVVDTISANGAKSIYVEKIQDTIERTLMTSGFLDTAKAFITYRAERTRIRDLDNDLNRRVREIIDANLKTSSLLRDNGNVNGALVASSMAKAGGETMKMYNMD